MSDVERQYLDFLGAPRRNLWLEDADMQVYVRKSMRCIGAAMVECLDIANVNVHAPGKGRFSAFLRFAEEHNPRGIVFIENVLTPDFAAGLHKRGYHIVPGSDMTLPCFYKVTDSRVNI